MLFLKKSPLICLQCQIGFFLYFLVSLNIIYYLFQSRMNSRFVPRVIALWFWSEYSPLWLVLLSLKTQKNNDWSTISPSTTLSLCIDKCIAKIISNSLCQSLVPYWETDTKCNISRWSNTQIMVESKITGNKYEQRTWGQIKKKNANKTGGNKWHVF